MNLMRLIPSLFGAWATLGTNHPITHWDSNTGDATGWHSQWISGPTTTKDSKWRDVGKLTKVQLRLDVLWHAGATAWRQPVALVSTAFGNGVQLNDAKLRTTWRRSWVLQCFQILHDATSPQPTLWKCHTKSLAGLQQTDIFRLI